MYACAMLTYQDASSAQQRSGRDCLTCMLIGMQILAVAAIHALELAEVIVAHCDEHLLCADEPALVKPAYVVRKR